MEKIYDFVRSIVQPDILNVGKWEHGSPVGITVHYSAERNLAKTLRTMAKTKLGYHVLIARDGSAHQTAYIDKVVNHAGNAMWNNFSPNKNHIAVSLLSWGELARNDKGLQSWIGTKVPESEAAHRPANNGVMTWWDKATNEQEIELMRFITWCIKKFGINPKNICGHDECAIPKGRKADPGGVLSYSMKDLRTRLTTKGGIA